MTGNELAAVVTVLVIVPVVAWFGARCLADLAMTSDRQLRYFNRKTWVLIIMLFFPIGPMLYMLYAKGPGWPW
jgi:hypothetical protein